MYFQIDTHLSDYVPLQARNLKILFGENADNNCRTESKGLDIKVEDMFDQVHTKHERWSCLWLSPAVRRPEVHLRVFVRVVQSVLWARGAADRDGF